MMDWVIGCRWSRSWNQMEGWTWWTSLMRLAAWMYIYIVTWLQIKASFHRQEADNEYLLTWLISAIKSRKLQSSWWQNECQQTRVSKIQLLFTILRKKDSKVLLQALHGSFVRPLTIHLSTSGKYPSSVIGNCGVKKGDGSTLTSAS
jgi:hypothetical protein